MENNFFSKFSTLDVALFYSAILVSIMFLTALICNSLQLMGAGFAAYSALSVILLIERAVKTSGHKRFQCLSSVIPLVYLGVQILQLSCFKEVAAWSTAVKILIIPAAICTIVLIVDTMIEDKEQEPEKQEDK